MAPDIRLSDETWRRLQGIAVPLEDTAEDVIRRLIDLHGGLAPGPDGAGSSLPPGPRQPRPPRLPRGTKTSDHAYKPAVLAALQELGGKAKMGEVLAIVERIMAPQLTAVDYERLSSGADFRWRNSAQWARNLLKDEGLLSGDSRRGVWELSEKGRAYLEAQARADAS